MNSSGPCYSQAAWGTAIPSLPSEPADRLYWLEGQLFVAIPIWRYQALVGSQPGAHASQSSFPSHDPGVPALSSAVLTSAPGSSPAPTATPCTVESSTSSVELHSSLPENPRPRTRVLVGGSPAHTATPCTTSSVEPGVPLDNPRARTRVPVACANCHEIRKSCDAARPCQRCVKRGMSASCVDHTRAARRSSPGQSPSDSSSASMSPTTEGVVPFGTEGQGGTSGQNAPLFPLQHLTSFLDETAAAAAASHTDVNALWWSY